MSFIIIPDIIKKSKEISSTSKLIYGDILSLSAKHGYCYANNEYFAKIYDISTRAVSKIIGQLLEFNIIEIRNSTCEFSKAREIVPKIFTDTEQMFEEVGTKVPRTKVLEDRNKSSEYIEQKFHETGTKVQNDRNKSSNIIDNIKDNRINNIIDNENKSDFSFSESSQDPNSLNDKKELEKVNRANFVNDKESEPAENAKYYFEVTQVLELLTERTGVKFVIPKTRAGIEKYEPYKLIKERLNDKATLEDIFAVVEMKNKEWFGTKVYVYMKPSTLFRKSNFDSYLQQLQLAPKINQQPKQQIYPEPEFKIFTGEGIDLTKDPSYMPELGW